LIDFHLLVYGVLFRPNRKGEQKGALRSTCVITWWPPNSANSNLLQCRLSFFLNHFYSLPSLDRNSTYVSSYTCNQRSKASFCQAISTKSFRGPASSPSILPVSFTSSDGYSVFLSPLILSISLLFFASPFDLCNGSQRIPAHSQLPLRRVKRIEAAKLPVKLARMRQ
jgi:hypothetical protein